MTGPASSALRVMAKPPLDQRRAIDALAERSGCTRPAALLHWTVLPIGPCGRHRAPAILAALAAIDAEPFALAFDRIDCREGGIAALGVSRLPAAVRKLRAALIDGLAGIGVAPLHSGSRPHVTLDYAWRHGAVSRRIDPVIWHIDHLLLIESVTGQARHDYLGRLSLMPRQGTLFPFQPCGVRAAA